MQYLLSLIQRYALSRVGSTLIGIFVVISLIWFAGPAIGLSSVIYRLAAIGAVVVIALMVWVVRRVIAARRGANLQQEISGQNDPKSTSKKLEIQLLKEKMGEAISSLKSSELGAGYRGNAALYALPWYMIIGPSAAGKSTLLRQSGLHFPYASDGDIYIKGYGGTRNCDWWFSDQAVFLDTAGRYATEDDDREEWLAFLGMLRKHRRKVPINGVIVTVNLAELLTVDNQGLEWHVKIIRNRISELIQQLGLVFPVYLVFTKTDLLQGFEAFFEDLSDQERNQVWGAYLYEKKGTIDYMSDVFETNLNNLYLRLCDMRLRKVSMQRNLNRKSEMFDFPSQFSAAAEQLNEFINLLFKDNPYQETPQFAGVYFTSATQEGTPIERVIGNLRQAFGFSKEETENKRGIQKPYFIKNLFTEVVFQIQGGARANRKRLNWEKGLRTVAVLFALTLVGGTYLMLSGSYATNKYLLSHGVTLAKTVSQVVNSDSATAKQRYTSVSELYDHLQNLKMIDENIPWVNQVTLYRANEQEAYIENIVSESLYKAYWMPVTMEVASRLRNLSKRWEISSDEVKERLRPKYYETLKLYLQLTREEHFNYEALLATTSDLWKGLIFENSGPSVKDREYLEILPRLYLEPRQKAHNMQLSPDERLITKARLQLYTKPDPEKLYTLLLNKGALVWTQKSMEHFVSGEGGEYLTSSKSIPGIYTAEAWYGFVKSEIDSMAKQFTHGDWVMEDKSEEETSTLYSESNVAESSGEATQFSAMEMQQEGTEVNSDQQLEGELLAVYLNKEVRALYFKDYADKWEGFLNSIRYNLPKNLADKSRALMYLSSMEGPIAQLTQVMAANTMLYESRPIAMENKPGIEVGSSSVSEVVAKPKAVDELAERFDDIRRFTVVEGEDVVSQSISEYLEALNGVYGEVDDLAASVDVKRDSERFAAKLLSGNGPKPKISKAWVVTTKLINSVKKPTRPIIRSLLAPPVQMAWSGIVSQATAGLEREWRSSVVKPYRKLISGKFPFAASGDDAALADVAEFYRPKDGILWKFADERLSPYLRKTSQGWIPRKWLGVGTNFSRQFLKGLSQAQKITDALYTQRGTNPNMIFYLQPDPSTRLREMQIESNGQLFRYRNGPQIWQRFDWPGNMEQIGARVMGVADHGRAIGELRAEGPWGLFHLLTQADIKKIGSTHYKTSWDLPASDGGKVTVAFKLRADRQDNIFNFKLINSFHLPGSLFRSGRSDRLAAY